MNNDLISREALKKDFEERNKACDKWIENAKDEETKIRADATKSFICEVIMTIDNAPTVEPEITEKQAILFLINNGWLVNHDKELREKWERPQGKLIENKVIVETLREMLSNLCMGCSGCDDKCLDYRVLEYLLEEKGGKE